MPQKSARLIVISSAIARLPLFLSACASCCGVTFPPFLHAFVRSNFYAGLSAKGGDCVGLRCCGIGKATGNRKPTGSLQSVVVVGRGRLREDRPRHAEKEPD